MAKTNTPKKKTAVKTKGTLKKTAMSTKKTPSDEMKSASEDSKAKNKNISEKAMKALIAQGKKQGYLTYEEITKEEYENADHVR